jgi:drug/metabolite transporter (DMT)-like permease
MGENNGTGFVGNYPRGRRQLEMQRFNGQFAVALTAALSIILLLSLLALLACILWQPSATARAAPASVKLLIALIAVCLSVATTLAFYLIKRDRARNGKALK